MPHAQGAKRGDIWLVDLGIAGKTRPAALLTDYPADDELALITILPHTTALRGSRWELPIHKNFLDNAGAFHLQQIQSISISKLVRQLGTLTPAELAQVDQEVRRRLRL